MRNQILIDWINKNRALGYSNQQLFDYLVQYGYSEEDIREAIIQSTMKNRATNKTNNNQQNFFLNSLQKNLSNPRNSSTDALPKIGKKHLFLIVSIVVVISAFVFGLFYSTTLNKVALSSAPMRNGINPSSENKLLCGSNETCFNQSLKKCTPNAYFISETAQGSIYYNILGMNNSYCDVSFSFINPPNDNWKNKSMICEVNGSEGVKNAFADALKYNLCHGELYNLMIHPYHAIETKVSNQSNT